MDEFEESPSAEVLVAIADAAHRLEQRMDGALSGIKGISFAEYRLLAAIGASPEGRLSRVNLAETVALSSSGVTRSLKPLEKLGFVRTEKDKRDARLALAVLTGEGRELLDDAHGVLSDLQSELLLRSPRVNEEQAGLVWLLQDLVRT